MRPGLTIAVALSVLALSESGCSSVISRSHPREVKLYPGVRYNLREMGASPQDDPANGIVAACCYTDLILSATVDTVLLPVDLTYHSHQETPRAQPPHADEGTAATGGPSPANQ